MADINPSRVTPTSAYHVTGVQPERPVDIRATYHGSVVLLRPETPAGRAWIDEHVHSEGWQWFGGALAAEPRYVDDVLEGARADGLEVE